VLAYNDIGGVTYSTKKIQMKITKKNGNKKEIFHTIKNDIDMNDRVFFVFPFFLFGNKIERVFFSFFSFFPIFGNKIERDFFFFFGNKIERDFFFCIIRNKN